MYYDDHDSVLSEENQVLVGSVLVLVVFVRYAECEIIVQFIFTTRCGSLIYCFKYYDAVKRGKGERSAEWGINM